MNVIVQLKPHQKVKMRILKRFIRNYSIDNQNNNNKPVEGSHIA